MAKVNWLKVVPEAVKQAKAYMSEYGGVAPTLRAVYYRLVSVNMLPNTKSAYKGLSRALTKARLDGRFPWECLADNVRKSTGQKSETTLDNVKNFASTEVRDHLNALESAFERIQDPSVGWNIGRWTKQEKRVIIVIEKDAVLAPIENVTKNYDVEIFPLRGYSSTTFMRKLAQRIRWLQHYGAVELIIVTDYDPSGEDIARDVEDRLYTDYGIDVNAEKVLLTRSQIMQYNLPAIPEDAQEIAKLQRDPRFNKWVDGVFRVELDAMTIYPDAFRDIIVGAVSKHYDQELYDDQKSEAKEAFNEAEDELRDLYEKLAEVHTMVLDRIEEIREEED